MSLKTTETKGGIFNRAIDFVLSWKVIMSRVILEYSILLTACQIVLATSLDKSQWLHILLLPPGRDW
jgi:hypothetical protein